MHLDVYRLFCAAARFGSISRAAEQFFITQPAASRAIRQLESTLGCSLLFRTARGVRLTQEGEVLYSHLAKAFNFITSAERELREIGSLQSGEVRIGVSDTLCKHFLLPYLKSFNEDYPSVKIRVTCPTTPGIIEMLKTGAADFGIVNLPVTDDRLEIRSVMEIRDCFVAGEKYKHLSLAVQPLREIVRQPLVLLEKQSNSRIILDRFLYANGIDVKPDFELGNIDLLLQFAKAGFGIACVIRNFIKDELESQALYEITPAEPIPPRSIGIARMKDVPLSRASRELIGRLSAEK